MADTELFKKSDLVVECVQALATNRSGLLKIRKQLLKVKSSSSSNAEGGGIISRFADMLGRSSNMNYIPGTDSHEPHTMVYRLDADNVNPALHNF
jgi:hypothetical protein